MLFYCRKCKREKCKQNKHYNRWIHYQKLYKLQLKLTEVYCIVHPFMTFCPFSFTSMILMLIPCRCSMLQYIHYVYRKKSIFLG